MQAVIRTLLLVSLFPWSTNQVTRNGLCRRQTLFDDKLMTTYMIERHDYPLGLAWCAVLCVSDPNCGSFFYNKIDRFCQLHSVLFITPGDATDHPGTWYFEVTQEWCPDDVGFVLHRSPTLCYKVHMEAQTYDQAKVTCSAEAASLLKVKNADISYHMFEFLRASSAVRETHFMIGADDLDVADQYKWVDGEVATWTNWASGEPTPVTERCLALAWFYYFKWNDIPCNFGMSFICQIDGP